MRRFIRPFFVEAVGLYVANRLASGLVFLNNFEAVIITITALTLASFFVKPIINILILPLTLATLGLFKFIGNAITLFIVDLVLPQFAVVGFDFAGLSTPFIDIPPLSFGAGPLAYIAFSFVISFVTGFVQAIIK